VYPGPIIDTHTHPRINDRHQMSASRHTADDYAGRVSRTGVVKAAALTIAHEGRLPETADDNDGVLALSVQFDGFFFPACSVHPRDGEAALDELDRVAAAGARWLKLHPNTQEFDVDDAAVRPVVARAGERGLPVLFDAHSPFDPAQPGKFVKLAVECPDTTLILAHAHGQRFADLLVYDTLNKYPWWRRNVYVDISATATQLAGGPFAEQFVWVLRKIGIDRVLFGSDYPFFDPAEAVDAVRSLGFSDTEQAQILHDNAAALLATSNSPAITDGS
jgi:hypothetical protein